MSQWIDIRPIKYWTLVQTSARTSKFKIPVWNYIWNRSRPITWRKTSWEKVHRIGEAIRWSLWCFQSVLRPRGNRGPSLLILRGAPGSAVGRIWADDDDGNDDFGLSSKTWINTEVWDVWCLRTYTSSANNVQGNCPFAPNIDFQMGQGYI